MPKWEEKELFKEYCEDYNTGTLAHKKYYDYDAYARAQAAKDAKKCAHFRPLMPHFPGRPSNPSSCLPAP